MKNQLLAQSNLRAKELILFIGKKQVSNERHWSHCKTRLSPIVDERAEFDLFRASLAQN
ncbi:hypothetical protein V8G57_23745 [Collimonas sp. H4R21]|jgi:hypothetical protein|uniref:Transposase n=1 Tax=Collimonas rhizosphaerae TaxID=3126357 RepID=A0ABU9Q2I4_9BURK|nr:hypothetical protein [Collimonas sp. OK412]